MAIDPRISLAVQGPRDIGQTFNTALRNVQGIQSLQQQPLRNELLQARVGQAEEQLTQQQQLNRFTSVAHGAAEIFPDLNSGNIQGALSKLQTRRSRLINDKLPTETTDEAIALLGQEGGLAQLLKQSSDVIGLAQQQGIFKTPSAASRTKFIGTPSRTTRDGKSFLTGVVQSPDGTFKTISEPVDGEFVSILGETGEQETARAVVEAGGVAGAKVTETAKATAKSAPLIAKTKSFINTEVKLAEKAATERGEVLTDLARMQASLPGLTDVVNKLRDLAPIATSTFGGRVWDTAVKELGFGATKGATASTKFGAMVNNQVLPLLKPTFGAAFTVPEGDALRATMGDVNASVEEKMATLDAFMEQKQRDIEGKQLQLDSTPSPAAPQVEIGGLSDEDLFNF